MWYAVLHHTTPPFYLSLPYLTLPVDAFPFPSLPLGAGKRDGRLHCYCGWDGE